MSQAVECGECDSIVIALHADPSLERPEKSRVYMTIEERLLMLKSLRWTEEVLVYHRECELLEILQQVAPDVRILGDDYQGKPFTGHELPIRVFFAKRREDWSATTFRERIAKGQFVEAES